MDHAQPVEIRVGQNTVAVLDDRVLEIFTNNSLDEPPSVRFLLRRLEIRGGEPDKRG